MQSVTRSIFVLCLVGFFTVASAQLPPGIMVDKHLIHAEQLYAAKDYAEAINVMEKIIALQKEHSLTLSDEFYFKYAQVALAADSTRIALESVTRYLSATGDEGEFYKEALALMLKAEGKYVMTAEDFYNEVIKAQGTCEGLPRGSKCWMALTNHPECYVWDDNLWSGETATWSGQCSGHLPDGKGTLIGYYIYEDQDSKQKKQRKFQVLTGTFQKGKRQGHWTEQYLSFDGSVDETKEGSYVDDKKQGKWVYHKLSYGTTHEMFYVDGKLHGRFVVRYKNGFIDVEGSYVDDKKQGKWIYRSEKYGSVEEGSYVDDKRQGKWVKRYRDGIVGGGSYDADGKKHGEWIEGRLQDKFKGRYVNGEREGIWLYYDDGECRSRIYKDGDWIRGKDGKLSRGLKKEICREAGLIP